MLREEKAGSHNDNLQTHAQTTSLTAGCVKCLRRSALSGGLVHMKCFRVVSQCLFKTLYLFVAPSLLLISKQLQLTGLFLNRLQQLKWHSCDVLLSHVSFIPFVSLLCSCSISFVFNLFYSFNFNAFYVLCTALWIEKQLTYFCFLKIQFCTTSVCLYCMFTCFTLQDCAHNLISSLLYTVK